MGLGFGAVFFLSNSSQDIRQQASVAGPPGGSCIGEGQCKTSGGSCCSGKDTFVGMTSCPTGYKCIAQTGGPTGPGTAGCSGGTCVPTTVSCSSNTTTSQPGGCNSGYKACCPLDKVCVPGATQCDNKTKTLTRCLNDGSGWDFVKPSTACGEAQTTECPSGYAKSVSCNSNQRKVEKLAAAGGVNCYKCVAKTSCYKLTDGCTASTIESASCTASKGQYNTQADCVKNVTTITEIRAGVVCTTPGCKCIDGPDAGKTIANKQTCSVKHCYTTATGCASASPIAANKTECVSSKGEYNDKKTCQGSGSLSPSPSPSPSPSSPPTCQKAGDCRRAGYACCAGTTPTVDSSCPGQAQGMTGERCKENIGDVTLCQEYLSASACTAAKCSWENNRCSGSVVCSPANSCLTSNLWCGSNNKITSLACNHSVLMSCAKDGTADGDCSSKTSYSRCIYGKLVDDNSCPQKIAVLPCPAQSITNNAGACECTGLQDKKKHIFGAEAGLPIQCNISSLQTQVSKISCPLGSINNAANLCECKNGNNLTYTFTPTPQMPLPYQCTAQIEINVNTCQQNGQTRCVAGKILEECKGNKWQATGNECPVLIQGDAVGEALKNDCYIAKEYFDIDFSKPPSGGQYAICNVPGDPSIVGYFCYQGYKKVVTGNTWSCVVGERDVVTEIDAFANVLNKAGQNIEPYAEQAIRPVVEPLARAYVSANMGTSKNADQLCDPFLLGNYVCATMSGNARDIFDTSVPIGLAVGATVVGGELVASGAVADLSMGVAAYGNTYAVIPVTGAITAAVTKASNTDLGKIVTNIGDSPIGPWISAGINSYGTAQFSKSTYLTPTDISSAYNTVDAVLTTINEASGKNLNNPNLDIADCTESSEICTTAALADDFASYGVKQAYDFYNNIAGTYSTAKQVTGVKAPDAPDIDIVSNMVGLLSRP